MTQTRTSLFFVLVGGLAFAQPRPPIPQQLTFTPHHATGIYEVDHYFVYIAANIGAQPKAAINMIWSKTLDPDSPDYKWEEGGVVASSDGIERLAIGSNAASVWWVNGQEVVGIYGDRQTVIDDGVSKRLTLKKGANVVRAAIINGGGATDFCARFLDADDKPLKTFTVSLVE